MQSVGRVCSNPIEGAKERWASFALGDRGLVEPIGALWPEVTPDGWQQPTRTIGLSREADRCSGTGG